MSKKIYSMEQMVIDYTLVGPFLRPVIRLTDGPDVGKVLMNFCWFGDG